MTVARIQPHCRANNNNLGYFVGNRVFLKLVELLRRKIKHYIYI